MVQVTSSALLSRARRNRFRNRFKYERRSGFWGNDREQALQICGRTGPAARKEEKDRRCPSQAFVQVQAVSRCARRRHARGAEKIVDHFPGHDGLRFSPNALRPSLASSVIASSAIWLSV